ncbi:MAG: 50S ribosomal protein L10 [Deltaproteobacteria bacterium]|jgi:large subunit ribosomal protein L10|nr:50S ribosomal protein L10 [Deltaproteobacteria bacterium]
MDKNKKKTVHSELSQTLSQAAAVFITDFKGLSMTTLNQIRQRIRSSGGGFRVAKNTLLRLASDSAKVEGIRPYLTGNNAIAHTDGDPVGLAKALQDSAREQEKFVIKCGLLKDRLLGPDDVRFLSGLPPREALLGAFLGTLNAVPTSFVRQLAAVPQSLLFALSAIRDLKAGGDPQPEAVQP